ncbi:MAG: hypothetical protein L0387_21980 [Acidobacteria bacterium]|nr:hypothetical protein [Acidobacteriota bacterium]MCI0723075.1 hypothetical protein [Acidobacteriota bacterium]
MTPATIERHLQGELTIGLYAINPRTQRSKWIVIDADYAHALNDLIKLQWELKQDGIQAALEKSRRGGHLWIFGATPLLARDCRIYVHNLAARLKMAVKGARLPEGIEVFPRHDALNPGEFGNAIRGPLGTHQADKKRYWFYGADYSLESQIRYLKRLRKLSEDQLSSLVAGMTIPEQFHEPAPAPNPRRGSRGCNEFRILDHIQVQRKSGRNYWTRCPSCALHGHDRSGDNLAIAVDDPRKYRCWAGCTKEMIREALGHPIRRSFVA